MSMSIQGVAFFLAVACMSCAAAQSTCLEVGVNPFHDTPSLAAFSKHIDVLGCFDVLAEPGISDAQVLHVAAVAAELMDQDEDGRVDDPGLEAALREGGALMPVLDRSGSRTERQLFRGYRGEGMAAVLYADEVDPTRPGRWGADATVEEVLHTLHFVGFVPRFPQQLGLAPGVSSLSKAMDVARGGRFLKVPRAYPEGAWYHYDDKTCDYGCMAIEYLYWASVTEMGLLDDAETAAGIADEWAWHSPEGLRQGDALVHAIITDRGLGLPLRAPDGEYCPSVKIQEKRKHP